MVKIPRPRFWLTNTVSVILFIMFPAIFPTLNQSFLLIGIEYETHTVIRSKYTDIDANFINEIPVYRNKESLSPLLSGLMYHPTYR